MIPNKNCYKECEKILRERKSGIIRKVINKKNIWESSPFIFVQHPTGDYIKHFIVEDNGKIIDPFLDVEIPADSYKQIYRNPDEIRIV